MADRHYGTDRRGPKDRQEEINTESVGCVRLGCVPSLHRRAGAHGLCPLGHAPTAISPLEKSRNSSVAFLGSVSGHLGPCPTRQGCRQKEQPLVPYSFR